METIRLNNGLTCPVVGMHWQVPYFSVQHFCGLGFPLLMVMMFIGGCAARIINSTSAVRKADLQTKGLQPSVPIHRIHFHPVLCSAPDALPQLVYMASQQPANALVPQKNL